MAILVLAIMSSLFKNSSWTDSGLGFGFVLLFFCVDEWESEGWGIELLEVNVKGCGMKAVVKDMVEAMGC